jgi:DNA-binding response OmpR family regulator
VKVSTRVLLLVEDHDGDALLVREMLSGDPTTSYEIIHVTRLSDALPKMATTAIDVVVLDLKLPDVAGVEAVRLVRQAAKQTPIVVLTGLEDERVAMACIDAGAQDYLSKSDVRPQNLKRAIGYSVTRLRERQVRDLSEALEQYRSLSSSTQTTSVTAALAGSGAVRQRNAETFHALVGHYFSLLEPYLAREAERVTAPRAAMEEIVTVLGDAGGGPRDLLDVHVAALDRALAQHDDPHVRTVVFEARLLALEMMGALVDYYRVGQRRRFRKASP